MKPKPRVFIAIHYLEIGGAEAALIGLLNAWDYDRADVDLFVYAHRGELMARIPARVNLLAEKRAYATIESPIRETLRRGCFGVALGRWIGHRTFNRYAATVDKAHPEALVAHLGKGVTPFLPRMSADVYDLAISFLTPHFPVLRRVKARRKVCWIHTDYSYINPDVALEEPMWGAYDNIVSISEGVTESFCSRFPALRPKIVEIENIMPVGLVRERARAFSVPFGPDTFNLLTVGRFTQQKNFESIPRMLRLTMELTGRSDLRWHIVGYGPGENVVRESVRREGMEQYVVFHGKQTNPYPYMAACDIYIQPSLYEGKSVCVREAQALGRPVVITDYATARSQLHDGADGVILPLDHQAFAAGLARLINSPSTLTALAAECRRRDYSNRREIEKIISLIPL